MPGGFEGQKEASAAGTEQAKGRVVFQLAFALKWEPWRFGAEEEQGLSYIFKESFWLSPWEEQTREGQGWKQRGQRGDCCTSPAGG